MATETSVLERVPEALALSKPEAARMLGVSVRTVDRLSEHSHGRSAHCPEAAPSAPPGAARPNSTELSSGSSQGRSSDSSRLII